MPALSERSRDESVELVFARHQLDALMAPSGPPASQVVPVPHGSELYDFYFGSSGHAAVVGASPLAPSSLPPTGLIPGAPLPRKRVTGKQVVAERRREREAAKRQAAAEAAARVAPPVD